MLNNQTINQTYNIQPVTLFIQVFDGETLEQINFNLQIENSVITSYTDLTNFNQSYPNIPLGQVKLTVSAQNYSDGVYYTTISPTSSVSYNIYLTPEELTSINTFTVRDFTTNELLGNVLIEVRRIINNSRVTVQQTETSSNGLAYLYLDNLKNYDVFRSPVIEVFDNKVSFQSTNNSNSFIDLDNLLSKSREVGKITISESDTKNKSFFTAIRGNCWRDDVERTTYFGDSRGSLRNGIFDQKAMEEHLQCAMDSVVDPRWHFVDSDVLRVVYAIRSSSRKNGVWLERTVGASILLLDAEFWSDYRRKLLVE
jgi:hypothetical protein